MKKKEGKCSTEGCDNPIKTRGMCNKHYVAAFRSGEVVVSSSTKEHEIMKLKEALSAAEKENQPLKERIKELEERLAGQEEKLSDHEKRISTLEEEKSELVDKNSALAYVIETLKGS